MFEPGDAVFFSGEPQWGDAPQCDGYAKESLFMGYIGTNPTDGNIDPIKCFTRTDGSPAFDIISLFAANIKTMAAPFTCNNGTITKALESGAIKELQDLGIAVLISLLGDHTDAGWSNFTSWDDAQAFARALNENYVLKYGFDGIDIDDEYSNGTPSPTSLAMVTTAIREEMPDKILSIASYGGSPEIQPDCWNETFTPPGGSARCAADNITYLWDMSYGGSASVLQRYLPFGFRKDQLLCGVSGSGGHEVAEEVMGGGWGGMMLFDMAKPENLGQATDIVNTLYGSGQWHEAAECVPADWYSASRPASQCP